MELLQRHVAPLELGHDLLKLLKGLLERQGRYVGGGVCHALRFSPRRPRREERNGQKMRNAHDSGHFQRPPDMLYTNKISRSPVDTVTFEYKCVAGPTIVAVKNAKARDQAVKAFEDIMNAEAANGWEYVGIDEFHVSEPQGLFTRKRVYVPSKILVFRRAKATAQTAAAAAQPAAAADAVPALPPPSGAVTADAPTPEGPPPKSMKAIAEKLKTTKE